MYMYIYLSIYIYYIYLVLYYEGVMCLYIIALASV